MKIRYSISEKWSSNQILRVIAALEFAIKFYEIADERATLTCKMITGTNDSCEATADRVKNKRFEIRLNYSLLLDDEQITKAVFHEATHVKQFIVNGLRLYGGVAAKFDGKDYTLGSSNKTDISNTKDSKTEVIDYWFAPWEMEARAMEEPLYQLFEDSY